MDNVPLKTQQFAYSMVYYILWLIEISLLARFILKLLGANPQNQFVGFAYSVSNVFMAPFANVFGTIFDNGVVVEPSVLVAMLCYAIAAYLLVALLGMVSRRQWY